MIENTEEEYLAHLEKMATQQENMDWSPVLREYVEPLIANDILDHFAAQEGPYETWAAHAPTTIDRYGTHSLLILSGVLAAAATGEGTGHISIITPNSIEYGVDAGVILYAWAQQEGIDERNLPARPYVWLSELALEQINARVADYGRRMFDEP